MPHPTASLDQLLSVRAIGGSEGPRWAPDGRSIAFVSSLGGAPDIWSVDPADGTLTRLTAGMGSVGHLATFIPRWSPGGDYIAHVSTRSGVDEVWLWPADGGEAFQLTRLGARIEALAWAPDGRSLAVASNGAGTFDIYRVSVPDGRATRLTSDPRNRYEVYPSFTPDGHILYVRLDEDWLDHEVVKLGADGSDPEVILTDTDFFDYHYGRTFGYPHVAPAGDEFLFRSHRSGWINVWAAPVAGGAPRQVAPAEADQGDAAWSPDGRWIAYVENHNGTLDLRVVPAAGGEPRVLVAPEQGVCAEPCWSPDGAQIAYLYGTPASPNDVWVVDVASGAARPLTRSMLGGRLAERLVTPEKISYPTFDGREINAYLYRPAQREPGQRFPGLLWIHGGPTAQFSDTWQPQAQYFVSQGYVVLLPNVRGSSGYGRAFEDLNNADWGHGDLQDAVAGVEYLKTLDDVDPQHFGITGTSYGGIMSMAAVAWTHGVFQAAIPCSGYGDFLQMANEQELRHIKLMDYEFGKLPEAEAIYRRCSPIYDLAGATTPCFVLHGEGQYPGSTAGKDFALALEWNYKPFWYKAYQGETYYVAGAANVKRMLLDMRAFFDLYLKDIPHNLPDDGTRPLTHLSGLIPEKLRTGGIRFPAAPSAPGTPPKDMAN